MATAHATVVYTSHAADQAIHGQLFAGKTFWIGQRTPQRSVYVTKVRSNGGDVVPLEKNADYLICDHLKNDGPPGGISYEFIDYSIRHGELVDPDRFLVGATRGTVRDVSSLRPTKHTRTPFSTQDDAILWMWVKRCKEERAHTMGNEIYKQLEVDYPNHTWQAWRNRYIKTLDKRPEGWKQDFTDQAQVLLGGSNGQDKTMTTSTRTKRARSDDPRDQHSPPSTKKQRANDPNREFIKEEPVDDTNSSSQFRTSNLQVQARRNAQLVTIPPNETLRRPPPSRQLIAEQEQEEEEEEEEEEEAVQRRPLRTWDAPLSQPRSSSSSLEPIEPIDPTLQNLEDSGSTSPDEVDMDDLIIPEPEGGFAPETQFQTQDQTRPEYPSSLSASSWYPDEPPPFDEKSKPKPQQKRAPNPTDYAQNREDESDEDKQAVPNFHTLYASYKSRGYSDEHIATALYATSANPDAMECVLEELKAGRDVPQDVKSVWTVGDDKLLMSFGDHWNENIVMKSPVVRKHGLTGCEWRWAFLEGMKRESNALR